MKKVSIILPIIFMFFLSCEKDLLQQSEPEELVVTEAYLYAGETVDNIYLTALLPYGGTDTIYQTISDAEITISHNENIYYLEPADSAGYYHYPANDLEVIVGDEYKIEFDYFGKTTTATTIVPEPPTGVIISETSIYIDEEELLYNPRDFIENLPEIELNWDEGGEDYFYVLVENIEENPEYVDLGQMGDKFTNFTFVSRPQQINSYRLMPLIIIQQYGTHSVKIYRVNKEYADLYESMDQDSRNLNEPLTNINNGLGIFTAFSCDSLYFEVVKQ